MIPYLKSDRLEAGCDEAGRGCLAGSVFAAAVILPPNFRCEQLNDSKQLSEALRFRLRPIIEREAIAWSIAEVTAQEIDQINILNASILAMHRAVDRLSTTPDFLLIDGNRFKPYRQGEKEIEHSCQIKGDARFLSIAAASVLAKTYRDDTMNRLSQEYPQFGWDKSKGYPTRAHREAIRQHGITPYHRKTFRLLPEPSLFDPINFKPNQ